MGSRSACSGTRSCCSAPFRFTWGSTGAWSRGPGRAGDEVKRERAATSSLRPPAVLALAGLDPSGRAGLLADLEAIRELRTAGFGIATALTAQGRSTFAVAAVPPSILRAQLRALSEVGRFSAIKLGVVPNRAILRDICDALSGVKASWVI